MLAGRHVIITGATTGIGKELVKKFARTGAKVTIGHNLQEGEALKNVNEFLRELSVESNNEKLVLKFLDVADFNSVRKFASDIEDCHVLINNAGIMSSEQRKREGVELTMRTNFLGPFLLTNLLIPAMMYSSAKDSTQSRIVNLTSSSEAKAEAFPGRDPMGKSAIRGDLPDSVSAEANLSSEPQQCEMLRNLEWIKFGPRPYFMLTAYANASLCTILATTSELSRRIKNLEAKRKGDNDFNISVNSVCPGYVNTNIWKESSMLWTPFRYMVFKTPDKGSDIVYDMATSSEYESVSGEFVSAIKNVAPSNLSKSEDLSKLVWDYSCKLVNIRDDIHTK